MECNHDYTVESFFKSFFDVVKFNYRKFAVKVNVCTSYFRNKNPICVRFKRCLHLPFCWRHLAYKSARHTHRQFFSATRRQHKKNMSADVLLYDLRHAGYGLSKSTALGFASKSIKTCNVQGCELTRKRWEGVSDFRPYNDLINNVQTIKCESLIF